MKFISGSLNRCWAAFDGQIPKPIFAFVRNALAALQHER